MHVAFFRNLNQDQRVSPSTTQLVAAFERSGATGVVAFQSNGTVLFDAPDPDASANEAIELLAAESPWRDVAFVRSAEWLLGRVAALAHDAPRLRHTELSLFDISASPVDRLPLTGHRCTVLSGGLGYAVTENDRDRESNATPTLERALSLRVTSRGLPTLTRLVERLSHSHGSPAMRATRGYPGHVSADAAPKDEPPRSAETAASWETASMEQGGDSACWLGRVCDNCGALVEGSRGVPCWRCKTPFDPA